MTRNLLRISVVAMATFALFVIAAPAHAQGTDELLQQLCGKAEAPAHDAAQLAQAYQKAVDHLLPLMSAEDVGSRYAPQIVLQDMGSHAARPGAEFGAGDPGQGPDQEASISRTCRTRCGTGSCSRSNGSAKANPCPAWRS